MLATQEREDGRSPLHAGLVIRAWRHRVGLTQEGLAQALSVTFTTVSRWENGHVTPSRLAWRALERLAGQLDSPLLDGSPGSHADRMVQPAGEGPPLARGQTDA